MNRRILMVDDDPNILSAYRRQLRKQFELDYADSGATAIEMINQSDGYAVVVSDMQMPDIDGLELLCHVRDHSPNTVRMMLTGNADQKTATDAVNEGRIFRFINKPCDSKELAQILSSALEQYRLINAEQELLNETLNGSIDLMADVLSMVNPIAFGRSNRVRDVIKRMCLQLKIVDHWQLEIAAALSQIGSVTLPGELLEKSYAGEQLSHSEQQLIDEHPAIAVKLVSEIPRLKNVGSIIALANSDQPIDADQVNDSVVEAAEILRMVLAFDSFSCASSPTEALTQTKSLPQYENQDDWLQALSQAVLSSFVVSPIATKDLAIGMFLDEELRTHSGMLLVTKGQQITESLVARLANYIERNDVPETIIVRNPK